MSGVFPAIPGAARPGALQPGDPGPLVPGAPPAALPLEVSLLLGGTWTDVTRYALQRDGTVIPQITRGRADEMTQASAQTMSYQFNNRDGRFSPRNPAGPYYGNLTRNTRVRLGIKGYAARLRLADDAQSWVTTPAAGLLALGSSIDVRMDMQLDSHLACTLAGVWNVTGNRSWVLYVMSGGQLGFAYSTDGTAITRAVSTQPVPLGRISVRATLNAATGVVSFYTAASFTGPYALLGTSAGTSGGSPVTVFLPSAANAFLNAGWVSGWVSDNPAFTGPTGDIYGFRLLNGIGGAVVADPNFSSQADGALNWADAYGNAWGCHGTAAVSQRNYRFHGEMASLPQQWDVTGTDVWTPVSGAGLLRRFSQGTRPATSAMKRAILAQAGSIAPIAYWPGEDSPGSETIAPGLPGGLPMTIAGAPVFQADTSFLCSAPLAQLNGAGLTGLSPVSPSTGTAVVRFLLDVPSGYPNSSTLIAHINYTGTARIIDVNYNNPASTFTLALFAFDANGSSLFSLFANPQNVLGTPVMVSVELTESGGVVTPVLKTMTTAGAVSTATGGTFSGHTGCVSKVIMGPWTDGIWSNTTTIAVGHIQVQSALNPLANLAQPLNAWLGEHAGGRFARLCQENSIPVRVYGYPDTSAQMGAQTSTTLLTLLQECETADMGLTYESRKAAALCYRTLASMTSQAAAVTLDYSQAHLGDSSSTSLVPTDDDQYTRNDITLTRGSASGPGGSTINAQLNDGTDMSIGVIGDYAASQTVNLRHDTHVADAANWRLHAGTADQERFPVVPLNLQRSQLAALQAAIAGLDIGDYIQITSPPAQLPPGPVRQLMYGYSEQIGGVNQWHQSLNCVPETPFETGILDDLVYGHADTDGCTMSSPASISAAATVFSADTIGGVPLWTTSPADFPFDGTMGGEQMTVTNIDGPPGNFLSGQNANFEGGTGNWTGAGNCTVAVSTGAVHSGAGAMQIISAAAGTMTAASFPAGSITSLGLPCAVNDVISCSAWLLPATLTRTVTVGAEFYTSGGVSLGQLAGSNVTEALLAWTKVTARVTAPATSAYARLLISVQGTGGASEVHYADDCYLADVTTGSTTRQTFTVTRSVNGVVKSHSAGEDIRLAFPMILAVN